MATRAGAPTPEHKEAERQAMGETKMNAITTPVLFCYQCDRVGESTVALYSPNGTEERLRNRTVHGKLCHVYACPDGIDRAIPQIDPGPQATGRAGV